MKVLFLVQGHNVAASRYRVLQYVPYLNSEGIETTVSLYPRNPIELARLLAALPAYDCIFLQRKRFSGAILALVRNRARKIIYDFDDSVMYRNSKAGSPHSKTRMKRFADMVNASDFVIAGNRFLMEQTLPFNKNVAVIPTALDGRRYIAKDHGKMKERVTLGWIGDHGSIHYMEKMKPIFEEIGEKYSNAELSIVCDIFIDCENIPVIKKMWSQETEIADLQDMDIGLMPLMNDLWSEGKCGLKILQYFGVAVPAVCSPVGVNKDVVYNGVNGFYANSPEEWIDKISVLIEDAALRRQMGLKGRDIVMKEYTIEACAPKFIDIIRNVSRSKPKGPGLRR
ncbi:MAG: hypothetical protein H6Q52_891 [Deltaproteobacteria bacterium]|nr:hypothetical protein [Deltaproteobacteria bacterium]